MLRQKEFRSCPTALFLQKPRIVLDKFANPQWVLSNLISNSFRVHPLGSFSGHYSKDLRLQLVIGDGWAPNPLSRGFIEWLTREFRQFRFEISECSTGRNDLALQFQDCVMLQLLNLSL